VSEINNPQMIAAAVAELMKQANGNENRDIPVHARSFWKGEREPLSVVDAFGEYIMNILDIAAVNPGREMDMFISAKESPRDKVVELNIRDNGPGFKTGKDEFLDVFLHQYADNKNGLDTDVIGEAGIGAKTAGTFLSRKHHYSWSAGSGEPICNMIIDRDDWASWNDYKYYEDENPYNGPSFFNINLTKLNYGNSPRSNSSSVVMHPAKLRDKLSEKFAICLKRYPNVKIYTCNYASKKKTAPLTPPAPFSFVDGFHWKDTVYWSGLPAEVSVGLLDTSVSPGHTSPSVRISRGGVLHFESKDSPAHSLLIQKSDGSPLQTQGQTFARNIVISVDANDFVSTPIKNDLAWSNDINESILHNIGQYPEFRKIIEKIIRYNRSKDVKGVKNITNSYKSRLDKLQIAAAIDCNRILSDINVTGMEYPLNGNTTPKARKQKRVAKVSKVNKNKSNNSNKDKQPTVKVGGKDLKFKIEWVDEAPGSEHLRSWMEKTTDSIIVNINKTYKGYTDKIDKDEKKEAVYLADTIGHTWYDYRLEMLINGPNNITHDELTTLQRERDDAIAKYMPIIVA